MDLGDGGAAGRLRRCRGFGGQGLVPIQAPRGPAAQRRRDPERRRALGRDHRDAERQEAARRPRRELHQRPRHDLDVRAVAGEHPHRPVRAPHRRPRQLRAAQLPRLQSRGRVERPRGLDARGRLQDRARRQVRQRLYRRVRRPRGSTRLGRLAGHGQHPDGGVLQLLDQQQRPSRALREQAVGLLDHRPDAQGRQLHPQSAPPVLPLLRSGRAAPPGDPGQA